MTGYMRRTSDSFFRTSLGALIQAFTCCGPSYRQAPFVGEIKEFTVKTPFIFEIQPFDVYKETETPEPERKPRLWEVGGPITPRPHRKPRLGDLGPPRITPRPPRLGGVGGPSTPEPGPELASKGVAAAARAAAARATAAAQAAVARQTFQQKVPWLQTVLNKAERENLVVDGMYGPKTRDAIRRFQTRYGLSTAGIFPPQTEAALIQTGLNWIAQASRLPVTGLMDEQTRREIRSFQRSQNLAQDGIVGPNTRTAMIRALP